MLHAFIEPTRADQHRRAPAVAADEADRLVGARASDLAHVEGGHFGADRAADRRVFLVRHDCAEAACAGDHSQDEERRPGLVARWIPASVMTNVVHADT